MPVGARSILAISAAVALGGCRLLCGAPVPAEHLAPPREPLPRLLSPLRWETPPEALASVFPGAAVDEGVWWGDVPAMYTTREVQGTLGPLGRADMYVRYIAVRGRPAVVDTLSAEVADPRPPCRDGAVDPGCRASPPPELLAAFERAAVALEREYGKGAASSMPAARALEWERDGFTVALALEPAGEERSWTVYLWVDRAAQR